VAAPSGVHQPGDFSWRPCPWSIWGCWGIARLGMASGVCVLCGGPTPRAPVFRGCGVWIIPSDPRWTIAECLFFLSILDGVLNETWRSPLDKLYGGEKAAGSADGVTANRRRRRPRCMASVLGHGGRHRTVWKLDGGVDSMRCDRAKVVLGFNLRSQRHEERRTPGSRHLRQVSRCGYCVRWANVAGISWRGWFMQDSR